MVYFLCKVYDSDRQNCYFAQSLPVRGAWIEIRIICISTSVTSSLPVRGAWIEIRPLPRCAVPSVRSLPVRGAWIEMLVYCAAHKETDWSLPVRGAWIEIKKLTINIGFSHVAPRAGSVD